MKTTERMTEKRGYCSPVIEQIILDHEISLTLDSTEPPAGPGESMNKAPEYFNNDPFKFA
jgi:hypothetical protein